MNLLFSDFSFLHKYYSPDEAGGISSNEGVETFELLNTEETPEVLELDEKKGKEKDAEGEDEGAGEEDELKEIEKQLKDEEKEPEEEDLEELITPVKRKEILKEYPDLFKKFPYLEKAYYRDQQFTEILPTIADARLAVEKANILDATERQVMNGDISAVLMAAKSENQEAFNRIADNYLPTLRRIDQQAYYHVLGGVIKDTIVTMVREGRQLGEQGAPLEAAANVLNQFIFGSQRFQPHQPLSRPVDPREAQRNQQFHQQEQQRVYSAFESTRDTLQSKADNVLKSTIDGHLDPNGTMTDYVKSHARQEAFDNLETLISKDVRFRSILDKLWEKAFQSNFDKADTDKIKSAYLSKAKTLLPSVIKKARNDALKGQGSNSREDKEDKQSAADKNGPITPGRSTGPSGGKYKTAKDIPRGMSTLDVLMKD